MAIIISTRDNFDSVIDEIRRIDEDLDEAMYFGASEGTDMLHDEAVDTINRDTGRTATTIDKEVMPIPHGGRGVVSSDDKVAFILEEGSDPHPITGNPFLVFDVGGRTIVTRSVEHPGTRPYGWLERSFIQTSSPIVGRFQAAVAAVLG